MLDTYTHIVTPLELGIIRGSIEPAEGEGKYHISTDVSVTPCLVPA